MKDYCTSVNGECSCAKFHADPTNCARAIKRPMTYEEAVALKTFVNYCNCGGFAASMNGRNPKHPHMSWCAQYAEWEEYQAALERGPTRNWP
jgi:hypothetical protein